MKNSARVSCAHLLKSPSTAEQSLFCKLVAIATSSALTEAELYVYVLLSKEGSDHCCEDIDSVFDQYSAPVQLTTAFVTLHGRQKCFGYYSIVSTPARLLILSNLSPHVPTEYVQDQSDRI